jgi:hypothetical protein
VNPQEGWECGLCPVLLKERIGYVIRLLDASQGACLASSSRESLDGLRADSPAMATGNKSSIICYYYWTGANHRIAAIFKSLSQCIKLSFRESCCKFVTLFFSGRVQSTFVKCRIMRYICHTPIRLKSKAESSQVTLL